MKHLSVTTEVLDERAIAGLVSADDAGGIVTFVGKVRDRARGRAVTRLEYDAYPEMVESVFAQIAAEAKSRFAIREVAVHHRLGPLSVGDAAVVVAVSAAHRGAAFDACEYIIDELKTRAPIWKKEYGPDGAAWVDETEIGAG
jgi:molybdopterin synthase catalytic subunit